LDQLREASYKRSRKNRAIVVASVAFVLAVAAGALYVTAGTGPSPRVVVPADDGTQPVSTSPDGNASSLGGVAEGIPRLLLTAPGWHVSEVVEPLRSNYGEMKFSNDAIELELSWYAVGSYDAEVADLARDATARLSTTVDGTQAEVFTKVGYASAIWRSDDRNIIVRSYGLDADALTRIISTFQRVDATQWVAALPADIIRPTGRSAETRSIVADIPLPPGFDTKEIIDSGELSDRRSLGIRITTAVTCGWLDLWFDATDTGDRTAASRAASALAASHDWAILNEINAAGGSDFPVVLWEYADAVNGGRGIPTGNGLVPITRELVYDSFCGE
jgi:hypothetical protein